MRDGQNERMAVDHMAFVLMPYYCVPVCCKMVELVGSNGECGIEIDNKEMRMRDHQTLPLGNNCKFNEAEMAMKSIHTPTLIAGV